jgi:hypothetical protein
MSVGCGAGFTVKHGLSCKKGGLVSIRHDDVCDEWAHLCDLALAALTLQLSHSSIMVMAWDLLSAGQLELDTAPPKVRKPEMMSVHIDFDNDNEAHHHLPHPYH